MLKLTFNKDLINQPRTSRLISDGYKVLVLINVNLTTKDKSFNIRWVEGLINVNLTTKDKSFNIRWIQGFSLNQR